MSLSAAAVEQTYLDILEAVKAELTIPVAVKLSPFFTNFANMARRLDALGADGPVRCSFVMASSRSPSLNATSLPGWRSTNMNRRHSLKAV